MRQLQPCAEVEDAVTVRTNRSGPVPVHIALSDPIDLRPEALDYLVGIFVHLERKTRESRKKVRVHRLG